MAKQLAGIMRAKFLSGAMSAYAMVSLEQQKWLIASFLLVASFGLYYWAESRAEAL